MKDIEGPTLFFFQSVTRFFAIEFRESESRQESLVLLSTRRVALGQRYAANGLSESDGFGFFGLFSFSIS